MAGENPDFIYFFAILFLLPLDLWLLSLLLEQVNGTKELKIHPAFFSLNLAYAYLFISATVSTATCLSLYYLTYTEFPAAASPSTWLVRWGGIVLMIAFYTLEFPIKPIVKLLWPALGRFKRLPDWARKLNGIPGKGTLRGLLSPWSEGMQDTAHWVGLCILGGAVVPYLGILTVSWGLQLFETTLGLSEVGKAVLDLLLFLSDWSGAIVILTLMLNLLFLSFPSLTVGQIGADKER